ncbi:MAG: glycosyltransferase [Ruminococcus flavefaciens]|nr:glycosyltransferase [Ruminococcus flavefaciens]
MTKLILATEQFPYGKGEKTFILPELERLRQYYDITVLSHADWEQMQEGADEAIPEGVGVIWLGRPRLSSLDKVGALIRFLLDREGRMEIKEILQGKVHRKERLYQSLSFYAQAVADQKKLRRSGVLSGHEKIIYYSFWYTYYCYSMAREKRRYPNVHMITRAHGADLYHERIPGKRQPFKHQMEKRLGAIVFACEYGAAYYETYVKDRLTGNDKLFVCKLGIERPGRRMPVCRNEEWELVSCSNVIPLKRIQLIIDGLALIKEAGIHWTHIGDGSQMRQIQAYAEEKLGSKGNIRYTFTGYVSDVRAYYEHNRTDCFITTSMTEGGCPVSIQEAMSYGVPVIGTDVGGITEMIADNGILLSEEPTAEQVAEALRQIMTQDGQALQQMKEASYRKWQAEFDINVSFGNMLEVLRKLSD